MASKSQAMRHDEQTAARGLDKIASAWANHYECRHEILKLMEFLPDVDWIEALRASIKRQEKKHPDSTRMWDLFRDLAGDLLGVEHRN